MQDLEDGLKEKEKSSSFFGKLVKLKDMLFDKPRKLPFSTLTFDNNQKAYTSFFIKKNEISLITDEYMFKYKFSSVEGGRAWCYKQVKYSLNTGNQFLIKQTTEDEDSLI